MQVKLSREVHNIFTEKNSERKKESYIHVHICSFRHTTWNAPGGALSVYGNPVYEQLPPPHPKHKIV